MQIRQIEAVFQDTGELDTYEREYRSALQGRDAEPVDERRLFEELAAASTWPSS